jgi:hypothetical protein
MMFVMGGRAKSYQRIYILVNGGQTKTLVNEDYNKVYYFFRAVKKCMHSEKNPCSFDVLPSVISKGIK